MEEVGDELVILGQLVVLSGLLERILAFVFEHDWYINLATRQQPGTDKRKSKVPGLKATIALALSYAVCAYYEIDAFWELFGPEDLPPDGEVGIVLTAFAVAGGSAGAIALFQSWLGLDKRTRDARRRANIEQAQAATRDPSGVTPPTPNSGQTTPVVRASGDDIAPIYPHDGRQSG